MSTPTYTLPDKPTWENSIAALFSSPYWLPENERKIVGSYWIIKMKNHEPPLALDDYDNVYSQASKIQAALKYNHMPRTGDSQDYFRPEAKALFDKWIENGRPKE